MNTKAEEKLMEEKVRLAKQQNTRVIIVREALSHGLYNAATEGDKAAHKARYSNDPYMLQKYTEIVDRFEADIKAYCEEVGQSYSAYRK